LGSKFPQPFSPAPTRSSNDVNIEDRAMLQFSDEAARKLEAIYSSADVVAQRRATLNRLGLRPGESVIDIGCGPGFFARRWLLPSQRRERWLALTSPRT
jgi:ubiquinone/menaquinone biosynthesis C-methylase UbiE